MRGPAFIAALLAISLLPTSALADGGPSPGVAIGWDGVLAREAGVRYVALPARGSTVVAAVRVRDGRVLRFRPIRGGYGVPLVTWDGTTGGLSPDERSLALASLASVGARLPTVSRFAVLDTRTLRIRHTITLPGAFSFDALSPDGETLYLIQHLSERNLLQYVVRAYDLDGGFLWPDRIADTRTRATSMQGSPIARAQTRDGAWVYTLYAGPRYSFIHALDTRRRAAFCIDLPWSTREQALWRLELALTPDESRLLLRAPGGRRAAVVETDTFALRAASTPKGRV
jgi:hypothetical protein